MPTPTLYTTGGATSAYPFSMIAQGLYLPSTSTGSVSDSLSVRGFALSSHWYRVFLAPHAIADGTETKPYDLLRSVEASLGSSRWSVTLRPTGHVRITYLSTGSASIAWLVDRVRDLLGFDSDLTFATTGAYADAVYQPCGVIYMRSREKDTGWVARAAGWSHSISGDGRVSGRTDRYRTLTRTFVSRVHPLVRADAETLGSYATPLYATQPARMLQPTGPVDAGPDWSVDELLATSLGRRCGFALGTLQDLVSGARSDYEAGYVLGDVGAAPNTPKSSGNWPAYRDVDLGLTRVAGAATDWSESRT